MATAYISQRFRALQRLDLETLKFLSPSYVRTSGNFDQMSKLDLIECIVKENLLFHL